VLTMSRVSLIKNVISGELKNKKNHSLSK